MIEINNTTAYPLDLKKTKFVIEKFLKSYHHRASDFSLAVVGANRMRYLNREFRGLDKTTDVLSFPAAALPGAIGKESGLDRFLGEVIINIAEVKKLSQYRAMFKEIGRDFPGKNTPLGRASDRQYLFYFLLVHGLLHLVGYDDVKDKDRQEMLILGRDFLDKML